jgi:hypothetical protein
MIMSLFLADPRHHLLLTKLTKLAKTQLILIETPCAVMALLPVSFFSNLQLSDR